MKRAVLTVLACLVSASAFAVNPFPISFGGTNATSFSTLNCPIIWDGTRLSCASGWGPSTLTNTYVGYGNASNLLTGSANLTFDGTNGVLNLSTTNTANARGYVVRQYSSDTNGPRFVGYKYRGSAGSPSPPNNGDTGVVLVGGAYTSSGGEVDCTYIRNVVDGTVTTTAAPMGVYFYSDSACTAPANYPTFGFTSNRDFLLYGSSATATNNNFVGLEPPSSVPSPYVYQLPGAAPSGTGPALVVSSLSTKTINGVSASVVGLSYGTLGPGGGGCGLTNPTAHSLFIAEGSSNCNLVALPANTPVLGTSGADPHPSTAFTMTDSTATEAVTAPDPSNPATISLIDTAGHTASLSRSTDGTENISLTNQTIQTSGDRYSFTPNTAAGTSGYFGLSLGSPANGGVWSFSKDTAGTVAVAFHPTTVDATTRGIFGNLGGFGIAMFEIYYTNTATTFQIYGGTGPATTVTTSALTNNADNLIVVYFDFTNGTPSLRQCIQVNNGAASCTTPNGSAITDMTGISNTVVLGNAVIVSTLQTPAAGRLDDIVGWNRALSSTERANLWNGGALQAYTSWPSSGQIFRFRFEGSSVTTTTDDLNAGSIFTWAAPLNPPTMQQTNVWPIVGPTMETRTVFGHRTGTSIVAPQATYFDGDSNSGLTRGVLADQTNIDLANGTPNGIFDTNGAEVPVLYLGNGTSSTITYPDSTSSTIYNVNTSDPRVRQVAAGTGLSSSDSGNVRTLNESTALLSAAHTDTTAASVTRGAGIFGIGSTPKWTLVSAPSATNGYFKKNSSGDMVPSSGAAAGTGTCGGSGGFVANLNADASPDCGTISAGSNITITPSGNNMTIASTGGGGGGTVTNYYGSMVQIAQVVTSGSAGSISFSGIPSGYTDLKILISGRMSAVGIANLMCKMNSDATAGDYAASQALFNNTTSTASATTVASSTSGGYCGAMAGTTNGAQAVGNAEITIYHYSDTTFNRTWTTTYNLQIASTPTMQATVVNGQWLDRANQIATVTITPSTGTFANGTVATLYGLGGTAGSAFPGPGSLCRQTTSVTLASSTTETSVVGTCGGGQGMTLAANSGVVGQTYVLDAEGYIADTLTPTLEMKMKFGSVVVLDTGAVTLAAITGTQRLIFHGTATVRTAGASGNVFAQGEMCYYSAAGTKSCADIVNTSVSSAIDFTSSKLLDATAQWGTNSGSNTLTISNLTAGVLQ